MRPLKTLLLLSLLALVHLTSAQSTYTQGAYEFETCGVNCTLSGAGWGTLNNGAQTYLFSAGAATDYIEFTAQGQQISIVRAVSSGFASMQVCINASCNTISNNNSVTVYNLAYIAPLTGGTDTIRITGNNVYLDQFYIFAAPGGGPSPTPQPTSTPAPTVTPQPTWTLAPSITPQPTSTPLILATSVEIGVYATTTSGQMTRFDYAATAGGVQIVNQLSLILYSIWGFFFLFIFIAARRKFSKPVQKQDQTR